MPTARTGVIAQDVAKVLPDAVYTSKKSQNPFISEVTSIFSNSFEEIRKDKTVMKKILLINYIFS